MLSALDVRHLLDPKSHAQNEKDVLATLELPGIELMDAEAGLALLRAWKSEISVQTSFVEAAGKRWTEATVFKRQ